MAEQAMQQRGPVAARQPAHAAPVAGPVQAKLVQLAAALNGSPAVQQLKPIKKKLAQRAAAPLQRKGEEGVQRAAPGAPVQRKANHTGLPDQLKGGIESLSGLSMDHVRVHYNSPHPAQLNAHAYAQGADIHVAPGQQRHLPHEAWHVVQQAQGRVKPTMQMHGGVSVNDDRGLEHEADRMGAIAARAT